MGDFLRYRNSVTNNRARGLTASQLYAKSNRSIINTIVADQIKVIDAKISTLHQSGFNHIEHELPTNFAINNMDKSDAQTMIYSELITIYKTKEPEGKGFEEVYIDGSKTIPILHIYWLNGMNEAEREQRIKIIRDCMALRKNKK